MKLLLFVSAHFRLFLLGFALLLAADLALLLPQVRLLLINAQGGCFPWSPAAVEYRDGMTLCPGQSATMQLPATIELRHTGGRGI